MISDPLHAIPQPDTALKEQTIREALSLFREQHYGARFSPTSAVQGLLSQWKPFTVGVLLASLVMGVFYTHTTTEIRRPALTNTTEDLAVLQEMKNLFGAQLAAIVQQGGNIEPILASTRSYATSQPLLITLRKGDQEVRIISFSGNSVTFSFDHKKLSFITTVTDQGTVIVEGKDFIWTQGAMVGAIPGIIDAKTLGAAL